MRAGTAPEGNYVLFIEAIPENGSGMITSPPSVNPFSVIYPQGPILINPSNESNLTLETPVFNWTTVAISGFSIEYDFLLVEVLSNQTPLQAVNSNRAIAEKTLMGQNTLVYTPEYLPLEPGQEYAWRVTASSVNESLPIRNDGESPIRTFVYKQGDMLAGIGALENIPLVPGFAQLTDLENLKVDERANAYVLNGEANIEFDYGQTYKITADVQGLTIQKGSPKNPNIMGGAIEATGAITSLPVLSAAADIRQFSDWLRWSHGGGFEATGELQLPSGDETPADGWLRLTSQGLSGSLVADNPGGIITVGEDPVELYIERFELYFCYADVCAGKS
ncbi:MAG: hypothetical protein U5K71_09010 [Gracilimonas sp.]|nr:hypothetical protein [Gracilimonas sp.]